MRILLTNDDGIYSDGLRHLLTALSPVAEVFVVAPDRERSATGHAITLHKPLRAEKMNIPGTETEGWKTNGTPADCVVLGILGIMGCKPDLVVTGINAGPNLGEDLTYSGTVSGAMEGALFDLPAFAISVAAYADIDFTAAAALAARLARQIDSGLQLPLGTFLNVNLPNIPAAGIKGIKITSQGRRRYEDRLEKRIDPRGREYYWMGGSLLQMDMPPETDGWAVENGYVSITPVHMNLTDYDTLHRLENWDTGSLLG
ncbi:MAG: 5'/3'-nucleotidase SurE [bacterium]|nr:5'/3'-nucleotidase SurE [bacterium]